MQITSDHDLVRPFRMEAGCFVLISNLDSPQDSEHFPARELLRLYKNQDGIEVLGLVLLISRLMEQCMRRYIADTGNSITG